VGEVFSVDFPSRPRTETSERTVDGAENFASDVEAEELRRDTYPSAESQSAFFYRSIAVSPKETVIYVGSLRHVNKCFCICITGQCLIFTMVQPE
jgi:hypothetical protein